MATVNIKQDRSNRVVKKSSNCLEIREDQYEEDWTQKGRFCIQKQIPCRYIGRFKILDHKRDEKEEETKTQIGRFALSKMSEDDYMIFMKLLDGYSSQDSEENSMSKEENKTRKSLDGKKLSLKNQRMNMYGDMTRLTLTDLSYIQK